MVHRRSFRKKTLGIKSLRVEGLEQRIVLSGTSVADQTTGESSSAIVGDLVPKVATLLSESEWVRSLTPQQFGLLSPQTVRYLTPTQLASIPDDVSFLRISEDARAALSPDQVRSLNTKALTIGNLTDQQVRWLSVPQIQSLRYYEFERLHYTQIPHLTPAQIATIPDVGSILRWSPASKAALTLQQVQSLNVAKVWPSQLTPVQVSWLTVDQIRSLRAEDLKYLNAGQLPYVLPSQIAAIPDDGEFAMWPESLRAALSPLQVQSLNVDSVGITLLTDSQVRWLTTAQVRTLKYYEFDQLSPGQIPLLTPAQVSTIPDGGSIFRWSSASRAALTAAQVQALNVARVSISRLTDQQINWLTTAQVRSLPPAQIPYITPGVTPLLTLSQIAAVATPETFPKLPHDVRIALTPLQVQSLPVGQIGVGLLTEAQVHWLTPAQVQQLKYYEFSKLSVAQVPHLSAAQLQTIPDRGSLYYWHRANVAALTLSQVRALDVAKLRIDQLTPQQVNWLYPAQVKTLCPEDFKYLHPHQIQHLTRHQMSTVPNGGILLGLSDEARAQLTRTQLLSLPWKVWGEYANVNPEQAPPENYHAAIETLIGPDGTPINEHANAEAAKVYALVPLANATHVTVASGVWSDPKIWRNGEVPGRGARVVISSGTIVHFNQYMDNAISTLRIDGVLRFFTSRDTQLKADTIVVSSIGALHVGTQSDPVQDAYTAKIVIADNGPINTKWDPYLFSRGIISRGHVQMYGMQVTPYASLALNPSKGDTRLFFKEALTGWSVGDRLVIAGNNSTFPDYFQEEVVITAINGAAVTINRPLYYNHHAPAGLSMHVANLKRNVMLVAEDDRVVAERPHLMFMHNPAVNVQNVGVYGFGRTDKSVIINDPVVVNGVLQPGTGLNSRARYAMHFHHTGVNPAYAPALVKGSVVVGSPGWGYVNHSSNVIMDNNVAVGVYGSSFVTEDGNEIGLMNRNLSLGTGGAQEGMTERRAVHDFGFRGHGFWMQGPGVRLTGNISAGNKGAAFAYFTESSMNRYDAVNLDNPALAEGHLAIPVGAAPLREFSNNIAYGSRTGLEIWHHQTLMPGEQSVIDNFLSWNTFDYGIDLVYSGNMTFRNSTLISDIFGVRGYGVRTNWLTHDINFENVNIAGFEIGIETPVRGTTTITGGRIAAAQAIFIEKGHEALRSVLVKEQPTFITLSELLLDGRTQYNYYMTGTYSRDDFDLRTLRSLTDADDIRIATAEGMVNLYYYEQIAQVAPFPRHRAYGLVPEEYLDKTNAELVQLYGTSFNGNLPPTGFRGSVGVFGLVGGPGL